MVTLPSNLVLDQPSITCLGENPSNELISESLEIQTSFYSAASYACALPFLLVYFNFPVAAVRTGSSLGPGDKNREQTSLLGKSFPLFWSCSAGWTRVTLPLATQLTRYVNA